MKKVLILLLVVAVILLGGQALACWNVINIGFDSEFCFYASTNTTEPMQPVRAYIVMQNLLLPRYTLDKVVGWDGCVEIVGPVIDMSYTTSIGTNSLTPPCYSVIIAPEQAPPAAGCVVVATIDLIQVSPDEMTYFYIRGIGNSPNSPQAHVTIQENDAIRNINLVPGGRELGLDGAAGIINGEYSVVPSDLSTWGSVKVLYR